MYRQILRSLIVFEGLKSEACASAITGTQVFERKVL